MVDLLKESVEEVFQNNFGLEPTPSRDFPEEAGYTATIPVTDGRRNYSVRIWLEKPALQRLSDILLMEENPDEATLEDLTAEVANFIVGHAKMIASDRDLPYAIQTPRYDGKNRLVPDSRTLLYSIAGRRVALQLEETHG